MNYTQSEEYLFNTMPVGRAIASLAVPTVISQIVTVIYNMAGTFFRNHSVSHTSGLCRSCFIGF